MYQSEFVRDCISAFTAGPGTVEGVCMLETASLSMGGLGAEETKGVDESESDSGAAEGVCGGEELLQRRVRTSANVMKFVKELMVRF
jgi:hypothetical protein